MLIASVSIPPEALALEHSASAVPEIEIEAERIAAHSTEWVMPCLWVAHPEFDAVKDAFQSDPSVETIIETVRFNDEAYYHVEWAEEVEQRINSYIDKEGSILEARLREGNWELDFRFTHREQFDAFREHLLDRSYSFELLGLYEPEQPHQGYRDLTPAQRDALVTAAEHGYFRIPRETTTAELADELDVTHQAVSELLRRGIENLIFSTLTAETQPEQ
ncbi:MULTISPECIES: helix-turn-helix domain-containing protein [Natrialbaceae]|uniref:helix-turn-helix domain-containing protein n=1 Tax=Natrialbaceae TaxID=1644061 RepID=UPI00207D6D39|nr:helix-turn-helix domain-containing protein [Natronococcus sp. CG52]